MLTRAVHLGINVILQHAFIFFEHNNFTRPSMEKRMASSGSPPRVGCHNWRSYKHATIYPITITSLQYGHDMQAPTC